MREDQGVFAELFNALGILALWGFNSTHCRHALQVIFSERCVKRSENALDTEPGNTAEELCGCFVFGFFFDGVSWEVAAGGTQTKWWSVDSPEMKFSRIHTRIHTHMYTKHTESVLLYSDS